MRRLHNAREYSKVLSSRQSCRGDFFSLHHCTSVTGIARLGLVIPKRLARHAVTRNLIRRQAREAFRCRYGVLPAIDIVLRLTKSTKDVGLDRALQKEKFRSDIESLLGLVSEGNVVELGNRVES